MIVELIFKMVQCRISTFILGPIIIHIIGLLTPVGSCFYLGWGPWKRGDEYNDT